MKYLSVRNWAQFQHYKDRNPIWIKLHTALIDDYEFGQLGEVAQAHLLKLWILASKMDNKIPYDLAWITQRIGAKSPVDIDEFIVLGYLEPYNEATANGKREEWASRYISAQTRADVLSRCAHKCVVCGATQHLEIDHIVPISKGGTGHPDNLQVLCRSCNRKKRTTLQTEGAAHLRSKSLRTKPAQRSLEKRRDREETENNILPATRAPNWVDSAREIFTRVGTFPHGRIGKALSPVVQQYGWPDTERGLRDYVAAPKNGRSKTPEYFAQESGTWVIGAREPMADEWGVPTQRADRILGVVP